MAGDAWQQCRAQLAGVQDGGEQAAVWGLAEVAGGDGEGSAGSCEGSGVYEVKR